MTQDTFYIVHMIKGPKGPNRWFAVTKRTPEFNAAYFHGIGVWTDKDPSGEGVELDMESMRDEYIPWHRIDHITNCVYKPR